MTNAGASAPPDTMARASTLTLDETFLRGLLAELAGGARSHRFEVAPNPCVGAAILSGAEVVGRGWHEVWGGPHAEVNALAAAAESGVPLQAWDALVVTLEPCASSGKTPPCTEAILRSGVRRVVVGSLDPDPRHRGKGLALLREAGIEVDLLEGAAPLSSHCPHFLRWTDRDRLRRPRPWTIAKWAQTRTGQLSPPPDVGGGRWISGRASLEEVHVLRGRVDAIVTSVSTVLADDPRFSVRSPGDPSRPPLRVVLDSYLRTPPDGRLLQPPAEGEAVGELAILCLAGQGAARHRALAAAGARVVGLHAGEHGSLQLRDVHTWLWERGARRILLEAGPKLLSRHLELGFVDQVRVYTGNVNGGRGETMAPWLARVRMTERSDREVGEDSVLEGFLERQG